MKEARVLPAETPSKPAPAQGIFLMNTNNEIRPRARRPPSAGQRSLFSTKVRIPVAGIREPVERVRDSREPYDVGDPEIIRNNLEIRSLRAALLAKYK